jgi:hypothetical protein
MRSRAFRAASATDSVCDCDSCDRAGAAKTHARKIVAIDIAEAANRNRSDAMSLRDTLLEYTLTSSARNQ